MGFPAAISVLLVSVSIMLLNGLLLSHENGNILSAAYGVTSKCGTIALHISIGIAQGVMPLIGYNYGAKNHKRVHEVCRLSFLILFLFSLIFLVIVQLFPGAIVRLFIDHAQTIEVGSVFMRCWSWCVIGMSLFNMYNSIFQAVGKWKTSLMLAVLRLGVIFSVLCVVLNALFGVSGLMWVQAITDTLSCLIAMVMYGRFKKSLAGELAAAAKPAAAPATVNRVITISREFGSGGRTIGKEVAARLGIPCYDSELIEKIAAESGLAKEYVEQHSEYAARDTADCLTVFIHASDEQRAERIVSVYGQREESPVQRLRDKDRKRKAYYELYTGTSWGQADNYELCLDSGKIGMEGCVNMIAQLFQRA